MATTKRKGQKRKRGNSGVVGDLNVQRRVEQLRRSFAKFRREHRARTRIPDSLRDAAVAAVKSGATELEVRRACNISWGQLTQWQQNHKIRARTYEVVKPKPRVFPIVDEVPRMNVAPAVTGCVKQNLELRVGGWSVCIRQVEA